MPLPHFGGNGGRMVLNEEKYTNERRRIILNNLFGEIDYDSLENMKKDFMEWKSYNSINSHLFEPVYKK